MAAEVGVCMAAFKYLRRRLDGQNGKIAARIQLQDTTKVRAAIPGQAAPAQHDRFFLAVTIQIGVENWREVL